MFGYSTLRCCRNVITCFLIAARSPGIISSSEIPTIATRGPKDEAITRRSAISSTQGTHQVAQTLTRRTSDCGGKTSAIFIGSRTSVTLAEATVLRKKTANGTNMRIGAGHFHLNGAVAPIFFRAFGVIGDEVLRAKIFLQLSVGFVEVFH